MGDFTFPLKPSRPSQLLLSSCYIWGAHWRHLKNTTEPSMCGGNAALCQITLTTCYYQATSQYYIYRCILLLQTKQRGLLVSLSVPSLSAVSQLEGLGSIVSSSSGSRHSLAAKCFLMHFKVKLTPPVPYNDSCLGKKRFL